jgi:pimeloyl-ACP methyl ester carboxylesterase
MTELHVRTTGSGPTVLFLHGLDSDGEVWTPVVELLPDHTCVVVDLPGHGKSMASADPADYERESLLEDLDTILAGLDGGVVLAGHSLGGYLGMAHALTREKTFAAMVLISTGPGFRDPDARERWNARVRENASDYDIPEIAAGVALHIDALVIDHMTDLTMPIALVIGADDKAYLGANDYMERKLPHANRTTVEGARHYVMCSHPHDVAASIRSMTTAVGG